MFDLYHGDCLEVMKDIPNGSVDAIICDPPYGITACKWDTVIPFEPLWEQYKRICKKNASIVLFGADPFKSALIMSNVNAWKQTLVWEKNVAPNFMTCNRKHLVYHEFVVLFSYGSNVYNFQKSEGTPYTNKRTGRDDTGDVYGDVRTRTRTRTNTYNNGDRYPSTVLKFSREIGLHPTQKPVTLLEYLIKTYTNEGDTVLDNCFGSCSTGIACLNTGRKFIGIEKDDKYFVLGSERMNKRKEELGL